MSLSRRCINCRQRPEGPSRVGVTPRGGVFVSRACDPCQLQTDRAIQQLALRRWPEQVRVTRIQQPGRPA